MRAPVTTTEPRSRPLPGARRAFARVERALSAPADPRGLAALRILFGLLVAIGSARFVASGFIEKLCGEPHFFFRYPGLSWVPVPSPETVHVVYGAFVVLGVLIALGLFARPALLAFVTLFLWIQLVDVTNYLNHYYLVILVGALLVVLPSSAALSLDARFFGARRQSVPFLVYALLRFQVGCVYVFASIAKIGSDWLLFGQPLGVWLPAKDELLFIGPLLSIPLVPLALSWCGFLYDATIVPLLLWRRTRIFAYVLVLTFHGLTKMFFEIGMFPFIMAVATTIFFSPSWPARLARLLPARRVAGDERAASFKPSLEPSFKPSFEPSFRPSFKKVPRPLLALALAYCLFHVSFPLRFLAIGDDVLWDEAGMRFSWRVMVREKSGSLEYRVTSPSTGRSWRVSPHQYLTWRQVNEMIGQPDMILALAHHVRDDFARRGLGPVEVRADSFITLNGRPMARFLDADVDLALEEDTFGRAPFVLPRPASSPPSPFRPAPSGADRMQR
jgi:vitamin K-dependent gamma-carboxylase